MAGVLFIVCVPRAEHERNLKKKEVAKIAANSKRSTKLIDELRGTKLSAEDFQDGRLKCKSSDNLSPTRSDVFDSGAKPELVKCKSEVTLSTELRQSDWEEVKCAISPKRDKSRISSPEREPPSKIFDPQTPLEIILTEILERLHVKDAAWCPGKENKYYQVFFSLESGVLSDEAIHLLGSFGIGTRYNSIVSVIPCALYYRGASAPAGASARPRSAAHALEDSSVLQNRHGASAWSRFVSSVRARTTLAQVLQDVRAEATITFDWLFLLVVAAFVAAIGLVEDSTVFLVASMLISPLMGPIMAGVVGTAVRDTSLQRMGVLHELFGLLLALVIGFLFGLAICAVGDKYGDRQLPTYEMVSRCEVRSLWVGVLVALPSSAGVALAVLGGYTASLVGVAISASLLPPAVNTGLLWAMALNQLSSSGNSTHWRDMSNPPVYSEQPAAELAAHGAVSFCLALVNILCIYVGGVIVYKIKEVAPIEQKNMRFWRSVAAAATAPASPREPEHGGSARGSEHSEEGLDLAAWQYFRWCSISERMRLARLAAGAMHHDTWSPYTHVPPPHPAPAARDIEAYCRHQASKIKSVSHPTKPSTKYRSAAQGYKSLTSDTSLAFVSENLGASSTAGQAPDIPRQTSDRPNLDDQKKTKFTVTPAFDPLHDN